jgi:hypothetical protein
MLDYRLALERGLIPGARATDAFGRTWNIRPYTKWGGTKHSLFDGDHMLYSASAQQWATVITPAKVAHTYIGPDGTEQVMHEHEAAAIERSGRSWHRQYGAVGTDYPGNDAPWMAMDGRPGAVSEGERPVKMNDHTAHKSWKPLEKMKEGMIHCGRVSLCDGNSYSGSITQVQFFGALRHDRACPECVRVYMTMREDRPKVRPWNGVEKDILMKWWGQATTRTKLAQVLGRTYKACQARYKKMNDYLG